MGAQASGSMKFAFPDGCPSFLASSANTFLIAQKRAQGKGLNSRIRHPARFIHRQKVRMKCGAAPVILLGHKG
ncbi:hypothetical protein WH87_05540 [Devosia epidermidihirudinis]|uniref:Uncharacterized protein n=1 Tax=Devosia epidermidihirudinis TaxID=1293439 RepID=A0A0F5QF69_9HYPH|nr:hypothetical protein WH87_05540 [Devosia epidermidihirudinis]